MLSWSLALSVDLQENWYQLRSVSSTFSSNIQWAVNCCSLPCLFHFIWKRLMCFNWNRNILRNLQMQRQWATNFSSNKIQRSKCNEKAMKKYFISIVVPIVSLIISSSDCWKMLREVLCMPTLSVHHLRLSYCSKANYHVPSNTAWSYMYLFGENINVAFKTRSSAK